jgi:N-terminal region of Chorein or VPS13
MAPSWLPLPSLLPSNLQKRLLSYALTHVLGTFLEPQSFSLENLELQILNGSVSLRNLELNAAKVNGLLKLPGVEIVEGRVGEVILQIPVRDVLSGNIAVKIREVQVFVRPCSENGITPLIMLIQINLRLSLFLT